MQLGYHSCYLMTFPPIKLYQKFGSNSPYNYQYLKPIKDTVLNPLNTQLNRICHLLALLGTHHILHVSKIRVKPNYGFCSL